MVRSCWAVAGLPLTHARLLPWVSTVRRSSKVSPASNPASSSSGRRPGAASNSALTSVRAAPSRITPVSARAPVTSCNASIRMDLPAPVSPVSTVKPDCRSSSSSLTMTKSRRTIRFNATVRPLLHSSASFPAACRNTTNPWGAETAPGAASASPQCGRRASARPGTAYQSWRWHLGLLLFR